MAQQLSGLETGVDNLERQAREQSFLLRGSNHKIAIAQGLSTVIHDDVQQLKVDMHQVKIETIAINQKMGTMQEDIDSIKANVTKILALLSSKYE